MRKRLMAWASACLLAAGTARAEMASVQLQDRSVVIANVVEKNGQVQLTVGADSITLPREAIRGQIAWHRDTQAQYQSRRAQLTDEHLDGHFDLAEWCSDQLRYDLSLAECDFILQRDPQYTNAAVLRDFLRLRLVSNVQAISYLAVKPVETKPEPAQPLEPKTQPTSPPEIQIDDQMIQRLRRAELRDREDVRVLLLNNVDLRFADDMESKRRFDQQDRREFLRGSALDKLYQIMDAGCLEEYAADIRIESDPEVFQRFRTRVWPIVQRNCATSGCHSGPDAAVFTLRNVRRLSETDLYANFLAMDQVEVKRPSGDAVLTLHLFDRDDPLRSLLLQYLLPPEETPPELRHSGDLKAKFGLRNRQTRDYRQLEEWVKSLRFPHPGYGRRPEQPANQTEPQAQDDAG
jgi:hypothetical protein